MYTTTTEDGILTAIAPSTLEPSRLNRLVKVIKQSTNNSDKIQILDIVINNRDKTTRIRYESINDINYSIIMTKVFNNVELKSLVEAEKEKELQKVVTFEDKELQLVKKHLEEKFFNLREVRRVHSNESSQTFLFFLGNAQSGNHVSFTHKQINNGFKLEDAEYIAQAIKPDLDNYTVNLLLSKGYKFDELHLLNINQILAGEKSYKLGRDFAIKIQHRDEVKQALAQINFLKKQQQKQEQE